MVTDFQPKIKTMTFIKTAVQSISMELGGTLAVTSQI